MNKRDRLYYKILPLLFAGFFGMMLFGFIIKPDAISKPAWIPLYITELSGIFVYIILILFIWNYIKKKINKMDTDSKTERKILVLFFIGIVILQGLFITQMSIPMRPQCLGKTNSQVCVWDFNFLAQGAADAVNNNEIGSGTIDYLHGHQNNIPTFYLLKTVFQLSSNFGFKDFQTVGVIMNIIAINTSIALIYLVARKLFGIKKAIFALSITAFILPLTLFYAPFFYTDTLSLPFPIAIIYLYLLYRDTKSRKKSLVLLICISLLAFFGSMIKFSVMIIIVAIIIDMFIKSNKTNLRRTIAASILILMPIAAMLFGYTTLADKYIHSRSAAHSITTPWTHYVMMGIGSNGRYNFNDDMKTLSHKTQAEAIAYNIKEIRSRLSQRGMTYPYFLYTKALGTWGAGDYESIYRLNNTDFVTNDYRPSDLQKFVVSRKTYPLTILNFIQAVQFLLILALFIGAILTYARNDRSMALFQLAIFGLAIFLFIWETNSRYLVNYLPLIIILASPTLWSLCSKVTNKIIIGYSKARMKLLKY